MTNFGTRSMKYKPIFNMTANLPYGPAMNTDIDYYRTCFSDFFCKFCEASCAIFVMRREASACIILLSTKQVRHWYHFNTFGRARPGFEPTTSRSRSGYSTTEPLGQLKKSECFISPVVNSRVTLRERLLHNKAVTNDSAA